jgi:hypothetical protein
VKAFPLAIALSAILFAQQGNPAKLERQIQSQVLTSKSDPAVQITFALQFKYAGSQKKDLKQTINFPSLRPVCETMRLKA